MGTINVFNSLSYLEPRCEGCQTILDYGVTTKFDEGQQCHVCKNCGGIVK